MSNKTLLILSLLVGAILMATTVVAEITKVPIEEAMQWERIVDPAAMPQTNGTGIPYEPGTTTDSPGYMVGTTYYDYQTNGSTGNRVAIDADGGVHVLWMNGIGTWAGNRWVYYNFRDENGQWLQDGGLAVNTAQGAGYCQISILADGRAVPGYHSAGDNRFVEVAIDAIRGFGSFTEYDVPDFIGGYAQFYWPYMTIDRSGRIHVISHENSGTGTPQAVIYTRSDDEGLTWTDPVLADTVMDISVVMTSSPVSDKVAMVYTHPRDLNDPNQYNNDMMYIESTDGVNWDFANGKVNITNYQTYDSLRAYTDCDAVYDYNDNLHVIWNAPYYDEIGGFITVDACSLFHWSEATGITPVADGWWPSIPGAWNRSISKMSIASDASSNLFAVWSQFNDVDVAQNTFSNGEIYMSYSADGGMTWSDPENLTNSPSQMCAPGMCDSDHWSSLDEFVNDKLRILYIEDKDAGGIPQTEGQETENPVRFLEVENPLFTSLENEGSMPKTFALSQNYPNPFNGSTVFTLALDKRAQVSCGVYDLSGRRVFERPAITMEPGVHQLTIDAGDLGATASGVYFFRLSADNETLTRRMVFLK